VSSKFPGGMRRAKIVDYESAKKKGSRVNVSPF